MHTVQASIHANVQLLYVQCGYERIAFLCTVHARTHVHYVCFVDITLHVIPTICLTMCLQLWCSVPSPPPPTRFTFVPLIGYETCVVRMELFLSKLGSMSGLWTTSFLWSMSRPSKCSTTRLHRPHFLSSRRSLRRSWEDQVSLQYNYMNRILKGA